MSSESKIIRTIIRYIVYRNCARSYATNW